MKKVLKNSLSLVLFLVFISGSIQAGNPEVVKLDQTTGAFTQEELTIKPGTYIFEVSNRGVDHAVGFVLIKAGQDPSDPKNHIQAAYLNRTIENGEVASSGEVTLEAGSYEFFCPLNPTPHYTLVVE
jgi:plastocyanin